MCHELQLHFVHKKIGDLQHVLLLKLLNNKKKFALVLPFLISDFDTCYPLATALEGI